MNLRQLFLQHLAQTSDAPLALEIEKAEGCVLFGKNGKQYVDLISGIGVSNVGHRHSKVLEAIEKQLKKYLHLMVYGEYIQGPQIKLAQALSETLPPSLSTSYFVNSGSEAIEGAMKLAKRYTQRGEIIACRHAYHGSSHGALSLGSDEDFKRNFRPLLPQIKHIDFNQVADIEQVTTKTAGVVVEVVQGEAGVRLGKKKFFKKLRKRCDEVGALLIFDEVQTGFGRTGTFWAFEQLGIVPDILVCAKGMGGGMPIGGFISSEKIMQTLTHQPVLGHITTFGGHPVSCAASLATLKLIRNGKLLSKVAEKEALFHELLVHPAIKEIRSKGLMMAIEFDSFETNKKIIDKAIELGVITDWFLYCDHSLRIAPPLVITKKEIRRVCGILLEAISQVTNS